MDRRQQAPGIGSIAPGDTPQRDAASAKESVAKVVAPPDLGGALVVASRPAADTALRDLVARQRGQILTTRIDGSTTTVEVRIPRTAFAAFVAGLETLGRWQLDREPTDLPTDVRIAVRLTE
jgi:hypothetical protein